MKSLSYQQALERIRAEFVEMPGMHLTCEQLERLSGVERTVCRAVLDDLVRARFLCLSANGSYCRVSDTSTSRTKRRATEELDGLDTRSRLWPVVRATR